MTSPNNLSGPSRAGASPSRGRRRENAILAVALELVSEVGFDRLSVDAIAARARASKETIYSRWRTKDEIVAEALRRQSEGDEPEAPDTGSLRGDLMKVVDAQCAALGGKGDVSLLSLVEAVRDHAGLRDTVRAHIEHTHAGIGGTVAQRATARGELGSGADVPTCITLALGQLLFSALLGGSVPGRAEREKLVDQVLLPMLASQADLRR
ncbi:TetR/AcrR family transcriptional regulator [Streptomyces sp. NEAU-YJ-81]|uniref:TetR/AcrR family transcriptional regulator n=1 Tax=Streptomyces sp. NEAU-YJ-81 TaxID=2820288 RepID=UPI001ABC8D41|nr:TetR/AcrR family transcriptional regulator [Streptomyces sp. NEAU-YJ-81]MBO3682000.1 TetR/AcrR family transcriptional regulator [Streptomyces sp. NEAU-YJ-81]